MNEGIYSIPFEQYEGIDAFSKHGSDALAISPLHYWAFHRRPDRIKRPETPAKLLGNALHTSILEPERFEGEYIQEPDKRDYPNVLDLAEDYKFACKENGLKVTGTKGELKAALIQKGLLYKFWDDVYTEATKGKKVLSESDWRVCKAITHRVRKHPSASNLLSNGQAEQSVIWTDLDTGVLCKARMDWITSGDEGRIIVDLKSTTDASPEGFQRSIARYRYYVQAALYVDGLEALGYPVQGFVFAAWEKSIPYASALYYATDGMLEAGRQEYKRLLRIYKRCLEIDEWPGYSDSIEPITLPDNFKPSPLTDDYWLNELTEEP